MSEVGWYRDTNKANLELWTGGSSPPVSDADYFVYGAEQRPECLREEYLHTALHIGGWDHNGDYLLIPRVVTDGDFRV